MSNQVNIPKFSHDVVVFDLEATTSVNARGFQTNNYIIDMGAVYLKGDLRIVSEFSSLVKPEESINSFIENLTGISDAMVSQAKHFDEVGKDFELWIATYEKRVKRARLAAWGAYFDGPLLRRVYETYEQPFPFSGTIIDVKSMAILALSVMGRRTDQLSISSCAKILGINAPTHLHRALVDAQTTAQILIRLMAFFSSETSQRRGSSLTLNED